MPDEYRFLVDGHIPVLKMHHEPRPTAAVIVLHGLGASTEVQRKEITSIADHGLAAVGVDAPHHGARRDGWIDELMLMAQPELHACFLRLVRRAVPEIIRVIDHTVDEGHWPIGLVGISMGAYIGLAVAAQDARVRATVSILGSPDWAPVHGPITDEIREHMAYAPVHRPTDCARHPLLMFNGGRDTQVPPRGARELARTIAENHPWLSTHVRYLEYPESEHLMRPEDWDDLWGYTLGFFREHLAPR